LLPPSLPPSLPPFPPACRPLLPSISLLTLFPPSSSVCRQVDLRWDVFLGTYYYWRLIKGVPLVPWGFIVPEEAPWPFFCRGVELGKMCDMIRRHQEVFFRYYPERVQTLEYFGWKWWWPSMEEGEEPEAPQAYNRYNNFEGMDLVLKLKFVDPEILSDAEVPDFEALQKEVPEAIPWREQDHRVGSESILEDEQAPTDIFFVPGLRRHQRRQARLAGKGKTVGGAEAAGMNGGKEGGGEGGREEGLPEKKTRGRKVGSGAGGKRKGKKEGGGEEGEEVTGTSAKVGGTTGPKKRGRKPKVVE
ncbi:hypothetical protein Naga_101325g2, partial [Nannochloropsis gaditana]